MLMRNKFLAAAAVTTALAGAASAKAGVTFFSYGVGAPAAHLITNFSTDTAGSAPTQAPAGYSWSGSGVVLAASSNLGAEPAVAPGKLGTGNFLSISGSNATETLTVPTSAGLTGVELDIGSLNAFNSVTFDLAGASPVTYTGAQLGKISGSSNGNRTGADTNGVFVFSFAEPVTAVEFQSKSKSLEIASISSLASAVPEPATWTLLILGVGMIGVTLRRRREGAAFLA